MWQFHDGSDWVWMTVVMAFVWIPIIMLVLWAFGRGLAAPANQPPEQDRDEDDPRSLARRAYARGELTRQRFLEIIDDLDRTRPTGAH